MATPSANGTRISQRRWAMTLTISLSVYFLTDTGSRSSLSRAADRRT